MSSQEIIERLKGGSFSSTSVIRVNESFRVRKQILNSEDREYGLVRWHSQLRKLQVLKHFLPENVPDIIETGVDENEYYFDIPYYGDSKNYFQLLKTSSKKTCETAIQKLFEIIEKLQKIRFGSVNGSLSLYANEEILVILTNARKDLEKNLTGNDLDVLPELSYKIDKGINYIRKKKKTLERIKIDETLTHGNLTLENIIYDAERELPILIDPYAETYSESLLGDISQLMQSSMSGYEMIMEIGENQINLKNSPKIDNYVGINALNQKLLDYRASLDKDKQFILKVFYAGQFVRMFPFKIRKTPKLAAFFLNHALDILATE